MKKKAYGSFRKFKKVLATTLAMTMMFSMVPPATHVRAEETGGGISVRKQSFYNKKYNLGKSLQPTAPTFNMFNIMNWKPEDDPDGEINRSKIPLNKAVYRGHEVNSKATNKAGLLNCSISNWSHDDGSSVGYDDFNFYAFDYWQYLDAYVYWSGSKYGLITIPAPDIVDAAHREGVPVHAMFGFPYGYSAEGVTQLRQLCTQDPDGSYPVMKKLIEVAKYYGFDGYFYNQETFGLDETDARKLRDAMMWFKRQAPELTISWYDSMSPKGGVDYQDALNDSNKWWMEAAEDKTRAMDWMFLNYNWYGDRVKTSEETAKKIGINPYSIYGGLEVQQKSYRTERMPTHLLPGEDGKPRISIALFAANSTMGIAKDPEDFHNHENIFYVGANGDPTTSSDEDKLADGFKWRGMSRYIGDRTAITSLPFYTDFNSSHGKKFFRNGMEVRDEGWNSRFMQKTTPTWRWWIRDTKDNPLKGAYDFDDAYNGGNSMKLSGKLLAGSEQDIMLYSTMLENASEAKALVTYKATPGAKIYLGIGTDKEYKKEGIRKVLLREATGNWQKSVIRLNQVIKPEDTIYSLSLHVESESGVENYRLNLGEMGIYHERVKPAKVTGQKVDESIIRSAIEAEARISWTPAENAAYYEVYQDKGDGRAILVNGTTNTVFYTANLRRVATAKGTHSNLFIVPVSKDGTRGDATILHFPWNMSADATPSSKAEEHINVCIGAKVTGRSGEGEGEPAAKAIDGLTKGNSKWCHGGATSGWMSIKLDKPKTIKRVRIEHAQAGGEDATMNTRKFSLEYKKDGTWVKAEQIDKTAPEEITDVKLSNPITADEFKLVIEKSDASQWHAIRIYEWQMFETIPEFTRPVQRTSVTFSVSEGKAVFQNVPAGAVIRLFSEKKDSEPFMTKKNERAEEGTVVFEQIPEDKTVNGTLYYEAKIEGLKPSVRLNIIDLSKYRKLQDESHFMPEFSNDIAVGEAEEIGAPPTAGIEEEMPSYLPDMDIIVEDGKKEKAEEKKQEEKQVEKSEEKQTESSVEEQAEKLAKEEPEEEIAKGDEWTESNLTYVVTSVKSKTVKLSKIDKVVKEFVIPSIVEIDGVSYKVTAISADVLKKAKNLHTLTIGKGIKKIEKNAFRYNKKLKLIIFKGNDSLKISKGAFKNLSKDVKIVFPKGMKKSEKDRIKKMLMR